jgi:hypothetical protein
MSLKDTLDKVEQVYGVRPDIEDKSVNEWDLVCYYLLDLYSMSREFHCLPGVGSLDDQDFLTMHFFRVIMSCIGEHTKAMTQHGH